MLAQLISARPGLFLERGKGLALARRLRLARLAGLARKQEGGRLDTTASWRFAMTAEGFTLLTEREEVCAGVYIGNSEVGAGSCEVYPFIETLACTKNAVPMTLESSHSR